MPNLYIISGCNGAGKTTASYTVLPEMLSCKEFVNADEIARGLSPFNAGHVAIEAGKVMLTRIKGLMEEGVDFAFETTLAARFYVSFVKQAQQRGYVVSLVYFWLSSPELAIGRVAARVAAGGHNIDEATIRARYAGGLHNLFRLYMGVVDYWVLVDNSRPPFKVIAEKEKDKVLHIVDLPLYNNIAEAYE
ncbi:MAG: zeta toxin family protein [Prevotellaceae bacterium]|jgi:predicted ABC-type ATPase|nr:zeta toxin family protein [Prevotellaceae bacterium]